jgi:NADH dehydrogenase
MTSGSTGAAEQVVAGKPRVVIVGGGFAGLFAARTLRRKVGHEVEVVLVNSTDYFLYLPLLPEVAGGVLEPRRIAVSLAARLPGVRVVLGEVRKVDLANRRLTIRNAEDEPLE